jgi:hypothetical protein
MTAVIASEADRHRPLCGALPVLTSDDAQALVFGKVSEVLDVERRQRQVIGQAARSDPAIVLRTGPATSRQVGPPHRAQISQKLLQLSIIEHAVLGKGPAQTGRKVVAHSRTRRPDVL